jgi:energy-converting hydrogenase Eha subunit F
LIACQRNKPQSCSHAVMQLFRYILGYTTPISLIMKAATRQKISPIHNLPNGVLAYIISYMKGELCKVIFNLQALASRRIHFM